MYGKLLLQVLALCVCWHIQGGGVTTAFMAPQPATAPNRAPLALNSYALARWGVSEDTGIANELIRGYDRWDDYGYGYGGYGRGGYGRGGYGRGNDYNYGLSYGGYGLHGVSERNPRIPWYCDNDLRSTEYYHDPMYYNGGYNRGHYDGGYNRGYYGRNNNYYGGRSYYNSNYGYGGGYDRNRFFGNGYY